MGGALNASEEAGDTQSKLDTIVLYGDFPQDGNNHTVSFKFSATPGEKFIIKWYWDKRDTILVATTDEMEASYTIPGNKQTLDIVFSALSPTGHIRSLNIDSAYTYNCIIFKSCPELTDVNVSHNYLYTMSFYACPALKFLDCSHNKLSGWYIGEPLSALTYLDCSHNDIRDIVEEGFTSLETLDCSYNHLLRQLRLSDCKALVNLRAIHNDSIRYYGFDLPQNSPLQSLTLGYTHQLQVLDLSRCPNLTTLNCYGNSQLTSLNLSNNPKLETLNCFDNEKLTSLYINHTSWDSLDLSSMPTLEFLYCDYNQLSYIDLSPCKNLQEFYCRNNRFSTLEIPADMVLHQLACDSNHIPLSILVDLSQHVINGLTSSPQFPTAPILQVGEFLDLQSETHLSDCEFCEHYTIFLDGQPIEERWSDGAEDHDYGLFAFPQAGIYRLQLYSSGANWHSSVYYDLTVVDSVVRPQFSIPSGAVWPDTALVLSTPTPDARIYYTADGSEPDETALPYTAPIRITEAMTVKAIAIQDTFKSHIATATYTMDTVARPTFSIPSGTTVKIGTTVSLSTTTPNASIIYTTDGTEPDNNALEYTEPIRITEAMTVKAVAIYKTVKSQVAMATYTIDSVARPTFSIPSGTVKIGTTVSLSTITPDARIIYTTDGTEPDNNALEYTEPIRITEAMTIKAVTVYKTLKSQVASASYSIDSVANEHDLKASNLRVYAKSRTIYLSEEVGEIDVFTTGGICVYRGFDTAIPVKQSGLYIVAANGRRWKVSVQ